MKNLLFVLFFSLAASAAFGQDCRLLVTNTTGNEITVGVQFTETSPNVCPPLISGSYIEPVIPIGAVNFPVVFETVAPGDPMIYPYNIGAEGSWITNPCWNAGCADGGGSLTITVTSCGGFDTAITVSP